MAAWAQPHVYAAGKVDLLVGYCDGTFRADRLVTRAEMAVIAARSLRLPLAAESNPPFNDADHIPAWASSSVTAAAEAGLIKCRSGHLFAPGDYLTRAEAVTVLLNILLYFFR
ncbi:S-layer homology domain-containing protein, partial [Paenibacillus sp. oral taxon 786]